MKSAMEQLIDAINSTQVHIVDTRSVEVLRSVRQKAKELLETEKKQIVEAYVAGWNDRGEDDGDYKSNESPEEYFNNTYKK